ncbi:phosphoserine phosphatase SerB [Polycladidibacter hongkongensis]|uniref:phosphoserine phosphatase SerB n=1 Tax=Polycladidibacter hongkongensis TaxID=1647556 RepID=UPI000829F195|nr:phosphoserine phosphatase SerB [Pseudovibrio hongkongensis]
MSFVVTLLSNPANPALTDELLQAVAAALPATSTTKILDAGIAADIFLGDQAPTQELRAKILQVLGIAPIDFHIQPVAGRRKSLLIADMDSTMIQQECIDELAAELGLKAKIAAITESAMRGEIAFEPALEQRVALLSGLPTSIIAKTIKERITLTPGGRTLVQTMRANGAYTALVSGGFTVFTNEIAEHIGFHENKANILLEADGELTGKVQMPILGQAAKQQRLEELVSQKDIALEAALAVGDGANDLSMIKAAGLGVAYHAKPMVAAEADTAINHGDLTALLYLQGYSRAEFIDN